MSKFRFVIKGPEVEGQEAKKMEIGVERGEVMFFQLIYGVLTLVMKHEHEIHRQVPVDNFNPKYPKYRVVKVKEHITFDVKNKRILTGTWMAKKIIPKRRYLVRYLEDDKKVTKIIPAVDSDELKIVLERLQIKDAKSRPID